MAGGTTARRMKRKQERSPKTVAARKGRDALAYDQNAGVDAFVTQLAKASPMQIVELERTGVSGRFIRDLSLRMDLPQNHMIKVLRLAKATTLKKAAAGEKVAGSGGQAALGVARLLGIAQQMAADSVRPEATGFDAGRWLGEWLERPQPSLGGRRPSEFLDTPTGLAIVERLLRSIESGSYQ